LKKDPLSALVEALVNLFRAPKSQTAPA
jgi:hypothetical protein